MRIPFKVTPLAGAVTSVVAQYGSIPFHTLSPADVAMCVDIAKERAVPLMRALIANSSRLRRDPIDGMLYAMDIAAVHCTRGLDLQKLRFCSDNDFAHDFSCIIRNIDRGSGRLPDVTRLRCEVRR